VRTNTDRLARVFELSYEALRQKINGGLIRVDNEASLQLHFSAILKVVGELFAIDSGEYFSIELEKRVLLKNRTFGKSGTKKANIDIWFGYRNRVTTEITSCAVELKYFKRENHREPNNRYDVFADLKNLEDYSDYADLGFMLVATDHDHYVSHKEYSGDTCDYDFRHDIQYVAGKKLLYRTATPYGAAITLSRSYSFAWDRASKGTHFLKVLVKPVRSPQFIDLFAEEPAQWGLRGDPPLWRDMLEFLFGQPFPKTSDAFQDVLHLAFRELTGMDVDHPGPIYIEKYSIGGMSSGQVDPAFWRERAFPLLTSRFDLIDQ
jgi:hypothetical protein